jgi:voltage-gated potassium channel
MFIRVLNKERQVLCSVLIMAVLYIFITALIMFNAEPQINPNTGQITFHSFFDALYWATVTLTTVGYGDLCPVTNLGRMVSMLSSIFGVAIIALPSGVITASYLDELRESKKQIKNKQQINK